MNSKIDKTKMIVALNEAAIVISTPEEEVYHVIGCYSEENKLYLESEDLTTIEIDIDNFIKQYSENKWMIYKYQLVEL